MKKALILCIILLSCTDNTRTNTFGGKMFLTIPQSEKFVDVKWNGASLWVLSKDTTTNVYHFRENSRFGILKGEVIINNN